jgi:DNA polymerase-1
MNWDSPKQVLEIIKQLIPKVDNVNGKELYKYRSYELVNTYIQYKEYMKLCTSYGEPFFKYFKDDNKVHTNFHQILDTGRVSSNSPNMQQIPANNEFRNCFIAPEGWSFVSSDYSSQELNVIAFGSKDPVWIKALEENKDLHSVCAELIYGQEWVDAAEDNCSYINYGGKKCNCSQHKTLRTYVKAINFGLAYGMGPHKLADNLQISKQEANNLITKYFEAFPAIKGFLNKLGNFGKQFGYIKTFPPFNRKRWFDTWYPKIWNDRTALMELGSIERASKNTPIQGASADMTKLALTFIHMYIRDSNIPVKLVMTVHDQIDTICKDSYSKTWKKKMTELMEEAAKVIVTNGLLKADTNISKTWSK